MILPDDLTELDQWVVWRYRGETKIPFQLNLCYASSTDPTTWCTFEEAGAAYHTRPDLWAGIGFVFDESDPFTGIDLDHCIDEGGEIKSWAYPILERLHDTYAEVSPSGTGIKLWCRARIEHAMRTAMGDGGVEVYDRARFFTVTGRALRGEVLAVEEHQTDVDWLLNQAPRHSISHRIDPEIKHGERHSILVSIGGTLARRGVTANELAALFVEMKKRFTGPPVPDRNLILLANDLVRRYGDG